MNPSPLVITISRQLGSGGAYIGQRLAQDLNFMYLDREILCEAAKKLNKQVSELEARDEKMKSFWESFFEKFQYGDLKSYIPPYIPTILSDDEIFESEKEIIQKIAQDHSCVIIGRGAWYILKEHPHHISIYLHADTSFRQKRVSEIYQLSENEALKNIKHTDKAREDYLHTFTKRTGTDATQYHLCINTGLIGLDKAEAVILSYINQFNK